MTIELQRDAKNRYLDPHVNRWATKILPGEYHICNNEMIVTTLGSCIAACIRDKRIGLGGMNHFMLPESSEGKWAGVSASARYGNFAMEHLINEILKNGGSRATLEAKVFGGGLMFGPGGPQTVGENNIDFVRRYLKTENIALVAEDVGGSFSRKVYFEPSTGQVVVKRLTVLKNDTIQQRETSYRKTLAETPVESDVELF